MHGAGKLGVLWICFSWCTRGKKAQDREVEQWLRHVQHLWGPIVVQQLPRDSFVWPKMLNGAGPWRNLVAELLWSLCPAHLRHFLFYSRVGGGGCGGVISLVPEMFACLLFQFAKIFNMSVTGQWLWKGASPWVLNRRPAEDIYKSSIVIPHPHWSQTQAAQSSFFTLNRFISWY